MAFILQVDSKEQAEVYNIYLRKAAEIYGVTRTRQIYETAIETLKESESRDMCIRFSQLFLSISPKIILVKIRFAEMETKLGEIDRARAIYSHASQMCDPRVTVEFWQVSDFLETCLLFTISFSGVERL